MCTNFANGLGRLFYATVERLYPLNRLVNNLFTNFASLDGRRLAVLSISSARVKILREHDIAASLIHLDQQ